MRIWKLGFIMSSRWEKESLERIWQGRSIPIICAVSRAISWVDAVALLYVRLVVAKDRALVVSPPRALRMIQDIS